ncbi:MAG: hypothetical protein ACLUHA_14880 [Bacteroides stercoris]
MKFTAGFVPMHTSGTNTRLTTNDNWAGLADRIVAVEIDGMVNPILWTNRKPDFSRSFTGARITDIVTVCGILIMRASSRRFL